MARVRVTISKKGYIPHLGMGPIRRPISITREMADELIKLGYPVVIQGTKVENAIKNPEKRVGNQVVSTEKSTPNAEPKAVADVKQPEPVKTVVESADVSTKENDEPIAEQPDVKEKVVESVEEETQPEENLEEAVVENDGEEQVADEETVVVNDPDLTPDAYYTEDFLTSKNICKKILDKRVVQYANGASFGLLKQLVKDSNPEVEIEE